MGVIEILVKAFVTSVQKAYCLLYNETLHATIVFNNIPL